HMGGVVAAPDGRTSLPGLFAVGECAATGVHGANRLASNSLLEAAAFGRRTGRAAAAMDGIDGLARASPVAPDLSGAQLQELRAAMSADVGVVRDRAGLTRALEVIDALEQTAGPALPLIAARLIAVAALERRESRGGHFRSDYPATEAKAEHTRLRLTQTVSAPALAG
ncbi:MAG TPA: FAD-binding protein, partial [Brevundimonas sp.]|nr:FAD-binding protein [Brevundimonas sp.]